MNLFERLNQRIVHSNSPAMGSRNVTNRTLSQIKQASDSNIPSQESSNPRTNIPHLSVTEYDSPKLWTDPRFPGMAFPLESATRIQSSPLVQNDAPKQSMLTTKGAKTPLSSLYNVSSNGEDDEDNDDENEDAGVECDVSEEEMNRQYEDETPAEFSRRSLRIRRSQERAKAMLPPDFADRIEVGPKMTESFYRDSRLASTREENAMLDEAAPFQESDSDDCDALQQQQGALKASKRRVSDTGRSTSKDNSSNTRPFFHQSWYQAPATGIQWNPGEPQSLEQMMPYFRTKPSGNAYLVKALAQRPNCKCALCGHESLLLFPVMESSVALAHWGTWSPVPRGHNRLSRHANQPSVTMEVQTSLVLFRQCRGWYEILNESFQPIPHLTTIEQMRRLMPSTFLIRRDLRCLLAPPTLSIPITKDVRPGGDEPALPSHVLSMASSPDVLMAATPEVLPAGTLMRFIAYLPRCPVKRGRKTKELGLVLATLRTTELGVQEQSSYPNESNITQCRTYYIGLEDSTPAVLPTKFSISPVAGPENISGVHSLASILRKFRLPLTIKPVALTENEDAPPSRKTSSSFTQGLSCGLSAVPGLTFGEQNYLRLESLRRSDLLIIAPSTNPERLYLVTPSMLPDHVFQLGETEDPAYLKLLETHRSQSVNFLAVAHPKVTLNYLVRHMRDVTRDPRPSYTNRRANTSLSQQSGLSLDESYRIYDELDDIYFYIRHGYYPSKSRLVESGISGASKPQVSDSSGILNQNDITRRSGLEAPPTNRSPVALPKAETLLAASLTTPVRNLNLRPTLTNGAGKSLASNYRREQGI